MAFSSFADGFAMYDATPVENLFLLEYMPYAPDDYVRAYLYGLMLCHHPTRDMSLESAARALHMTEDKVLEAFRYWEQKGLVTGVSDNPPAFRYVNVRSAMMDSAPEDDGAYRYRDFNNELQAITGLMHPKQFQQAMEWIEELRIPPEVVLEMARCKAEVAAERNGGKPRSVPYLFKIYQQTMLDWAQRDIRTLDRARDELARDLPSYNLAQKVLQFFSLRRAPTEAELALCDKWLLQWHYDEKTVLRALRETAASTNPSFAYVDGILENHRGGDGEARFDESRASFEAVKELLTALGAGSRAPTKEIEEHYNAWLADGFERAVLLRAAALCNERNQHSVEQLDRLLQKWRALELISEDAVAAYIKNRAALRAQMNQVFDRAGLSRRPSDAELDMLSEWLKTQPFDVVLFAAECACGTVMPTKHIAKSIAEWTRAGVRDVEGAKREREKRTFTPPAATASAKPRDAKNPALNYTQRTYKESDFDDFFADLSKPEGGDEA